MAPPVSYSKLTLPFPIFAAEFDPYRPYLVVGGGGGEGRSGVPNQLVSLCIVHRKPKPRLTTSGRHRLLQPRSIERGR